MQSLRRGEANMALMPLIATRYDHLDSKRQPVFNSGYITIHNSQRRMYLVHLVLIATYTLIFYIVGRAHFRQGWPTFSDWEQLPSPAREALKPELRAFRTSLVNNPFAGSPRAELDKAWHDLLQNDNIKLPKETLDALNLTSVRLRGSSEVLASLSTFHALHCLKKVRQMTYKEYYHEDKDGAAMVRETAHSDHCIEYLREHLMCKPDLSLITYHWINHTAQHPENPSLKLPTTWDHALHECANWDAINNWATLRAVDLYDYELLETPTKGLDYDGEVDR